MRPAPASCWKSCAKYREYRPGLLKGGSAQPCVKGIQRKLASGRGMQMDADKIDKVVGSGSAIRASISEIWRDLLQIDSFGIHDNFIQLGGDSLLALTMLARVEELFSLGEQPLSFDAHLTIASIERVVLADIVERQARATAFDDTRCSARVSLVQSLRLYGVLRSELGSTTKNGRYAEAVSFRLYGDLDTKALERALGALINRHEILRTAFVPSLALGSTSVSGWNQIRKLFRGARSVPAVSFASHVRAPADFSLRVYDFRQLSARSAEVELGKVGSEVVLEPFDYETPESVRAAAVRVATGEYLLLVAFGAAVFDGWSRRIFYQDLAAYYKAYLSGAGPCLPRLPFQFADYVAWEHERYSPTLDSLAADWADDLAGAYPVSIEDLVADHISRVAHFGETSVETFRVSKETGRAFQTLVRAQGTTSFCLWLTVTAIAISSLAQRRNIALWTIFANRQLPRVGNVIGPFSNYQIVPVHVDDAEPISGLVRRVHSAVERARSYEATPVSVLSDRLRRRKAVSRACVSPILLPDVSCEYVAQRDLAPLAGIRVQSERVGLKRDHMPLRMRLCEKGGSMWVQAQYRRDMLDKQSVIRILESCVSVLQRLVSRPKQGPRGL